MKQPRYAVRKLFTEFYLRSRRLFTSIDLHRTMKNQTLFQDDSIGMNLLRESVRENRFVTRLVIQIEFQFESLLHFSAFKIVEASRVQFELCKIQMEIIRD